MLVGIIASKSSKKKKLKKRKKDRAYVEHDRYNDALFCMTLEHDQEHERLGSRVGAN